MDKIENAIKLMNKLGKERAEFLFIIDFEMKEPLIFRTSELDGNEILFDINGFKNYSHKKSIPQKIFFEKHPIDFNEYRSALEIVMENIKGGNTYLLNLTFPTKIKTNLTLEEIFLHSQAKYKLLYPNKFVVFSPETFVEINDGTISSYPMKGTIDASIEGAKTIILNDPKETAEHTTIVDLIRNDLSIVAKNVRVEKFRYIDEIKTNQKNLLQVSSKISGELAPNFHGTIGNILFSLLPAGSISGAPKKKTVEIIKSAETYERGYYTGIFGYFDGNKLESGVMIRFIEEINNEMFFKSGGGITAFSNAQSEYNELIDKVYVPIVRND